MFEIISERNQDYGLNDCRIPTETDKPSLSMVTPVFDHTANPPPRRTVDLLNRAALRPHPLLQVMPLTGVYVVAFVPSFSPIVVLNDAVYTLLKGLPLATDSVDDATQAALDHLHQLGLITDGDGTLPSPPASKVLVAWLHVTNACNLRCNYCYLRKSNETMSVANAHAAIDTVIRAAVQHGYPEIALKYAGGEAALQLSQVEMMHTYALEQATHHGLRVQAVLLSNGTLLTRQNLARIRTLGLQLTISLDGMAEVHDAQRTTIDGRGSFAATLAGIEQAQAMELAPTIAITVTGQSTSGLPALVEWLLARDLQFTISFYRAHGADNDDQARIRLQHDEEQIVAGMKAMYAVVERMPPRWSVLGALIDRADLSVAHGRTCAVGDNYLVIDHHGRIAKCQMTIDQPVASVTTDDPLAAVRADTIGVQNLPVDQKEGCRVCEWRYWCTGGCAVATYRATGRYDVQSPNCAIYKRLYPEVVRLEGLRLLHWHQHTGKLARMVTPEIPLKHTMN